MFCVAELLLPEDVSEIYFYRTILRSLPRTGLVDTKVLSYYRFFVFFSLKPEVFFTQIDCCWRRELSIRVGVSGVFIRTSGCGLER